MKKECVGIAAGLLIWVVIISCGLYFGFGTNTNLPLDNVVQIKCEVEYSAYYDEYYHTGWQGSGVFIQDNLILTAGHIVDGISDVTIITIDGKEYKAKSWYLETEVDIGFIEVDTNDVESMLSFDSAIIGEDIWAYGNPFGVFPILTKGIVSAVNAPDDFGDTKNMIIVDTAVDPGNSGCPIFDKNGNILGIASWKYTYSNSLSYFVRSEVIELSLKKYRAIKELEAIE